MNIRESLRTGFLEIVSHKMRSFLSFSSISFGVAAILYTFVHVHRMVLHREKAFELAGPGRIEVEKERHEGKKGQGLSKGLTYADALTIRAAIPGLYMVSPVARGWASLHYARFRFDANLNGVTPDWRKRDWVYTLRGRFFDDHDVRTAARVCIVNEPGGWVDKPFWARWWPDSPFEEFLTHHDLLGHSVRIKDHLFTVVGVLKNPPRDKDPRWFHMEMDANVYVPITALHRYLAAPGGGQGSPESIDALQLDTGDEKTVPLVKRRVEAVLRALHRGEEDYKVRDYRDMIQNILNETRKFAVAVLAVGIIAILAGGVGIMNVTLATIFSRIREIGIRRALGATQTDILLQFVVEAMMLGFCGGVAGIILGMSGVAYLREKGESILEGLTLWHFLATLAIAAGAGFIFSVYPAYKASRLDPVEALRYE